MNQAEKKDEPEETGIAFNGSIHTLERINEILQHCSAYAVNDHLIGYVRNLKELFKESQGFLSAAELKTAWKKWQKVQSFPIVINPDDTMTYDEGILTALEDFDFWLRLKLHRHKVTMASKQGFMQGMAKLSKRYNLEA